MSLIYSQVIKFTISIIINLIMQQFLKLSLIMQIGTVIGFFCFFSILEYFKINHKIWDWIKSKRYWNKLFVIFLPLKEVIDSFKEYNIHTYPGSTQKLLSQIFSSDKTIVNQELHNLLDYAISGEIIIYGQNTESIQNLQPLNLTNINTNPFYLKENWTNDYNSVYDNGMLLYTNLKVRKSDLNKFIKKYKQPRIDIINS